MFLVFVMNSSRLTSGSFCLNVECKKYFRNDCLVLISSLNKIWDQGFEAQQIECIYFHAPTQNVLPSPPPALSVQNLMVAPLSLVESASDTILTLEFEYIHFKPLLTKTASFHPIVSVMCS